MWKRPRLDFELLLSYRELGSESSAVLPGRTVALGKSVPTCGRLVPPAMWPVGSATLGWVRSGRFAVIPWASPEEPRGVEHHGDVGQGLRGRCGDRREPASRREEDAGRVVGCVSLDLAAKRGS